MFATPTQLHRQQIVPTTLEKAWDFFSKPKNLPLITPPFMSFRLVDKKEGFEGMYAGQMISYIVKPIMGIPLRWSTEITHVEPKKYFVDEQRFGPYKLWHHQHHFEPCPEGVLMTDLVHYMLPLGPIGKLARILFVQNQLESIFNYRIEAVKEIFAKATIVKTN